MIAIPNDLEKSIDLNLFYSYGLLNTHTLPYSILYQLHDEFKFMNDIEKKRYYDTWNDKLVTQCSESNVLKGVAIQKTQKAFLNAEWNKKLLDFALKTELDTVNALIINFDEKNVMYSFEEEERSTYIILFYCNLYYYPLIHMYSEAHSQELFIKLKNQFSEE